MTITPPAFDVRRANLRTLIDKHHGPTHLAKLLGLSGPSFLSQIVSGHRELQEKTARRWEERLGLEPGWLDVERGLGDLTAQEEVDLLVTVTHTVGALAESAGLDTKPSVFAQIVVLAYDDARSKGHIDEHFILSLLRIAH